MHRQFTKNYTSGTAISPYTIVTWGASDHHADQAVDGSKPLLGTSGQVGSAAGGRQDVTRGGIDTVIYGGDVMQGDPLTADANGHAVKASPAADEKVWIIGFAELSGAAGDHGETSIQPGQIAG